MWLLRCVLSVRNGKSAVQFRQRANTTLFTGLNRKIINWVQCLNRNRALTVPDTALNGIEFGAVKARCLNYCTQHLIFTP